MKEPQNLNICSAAEDRGGNRFLDLFYGSPTVCPLWARLVGTFFGTGLIRPGPGSWASVATVFLWWLVGRGIVPPWQLPALASLVILSISIGVPAASRISEASGVKDPPCVVIDEVAGQLIALIHVPLSLGALLAAFLLFRGFDIVKPPPIRQLERLPSGIGVVVDDLAAGIYAALAIQGILYFRILQK